MSAPFLLGMWTYFGFVSTESPSARTSDVMRVSVNWVDWFIGYVDFVIGMVSDEFLGMFPRVCFREKEDEW